MIQPFSTSQSTIHDAYEIINHSYPIPTPTSTTAQQTHSKLLITCEHASYRLPPAYDWSEHDLHTHIGTHWSYDIGAELCSKQLSYHTSSIVLLARYSRLFCDANRMIGDDTMFRNECDGKQVDLNKNITHKEIQVRINQFYIPYHTAIKSLVQQNQFMTAISIHSYTAFYENQIRTVEIGILYRQARDKLHAEQLCHVYKQHGYNAQINQPWSGMNGYMYAVDAIQQYVNNTLMIEYRNDLLIQEQWRTNVINILIKYLYQHKLCIQIDSNKNSTDDTITDTISTYINNV